MKTQVGIIGAGPAGLLLSHLLHLHGIDSVILESRSLAYVEGRVRAGILDSDVCELFQAVGIGERMMREGLPQEQMELRFDGKRRVINWFELAGGRRTMIYGQQEVVRDLIARRMADRGAMLFEAEVTGVDGLESDRPAIRYRHQGEEKRLDCALVAGCDGYQGVSRRLIPAGRVTEFEHKYPFHWLGILVDAAPSSRWLVTTANDRGYAMQSMRSTQVTRSYLQIATTDRVEDWADERIWTELDLRLESGAGWKVNRGPIMEKAIFELRSFVCEPMQYRRMYLAGDSAHVVPPTGGRGLNQAVGDVCVLADAMRDFLEDGKAEGLEAYSATCLERVWHTQQFSWRLTSMLQRHDFSNVYHRKQQLAQLEYYTTNRAAATSLAECYAGARLHTSFLDGRGNAGQEYPTI